MNNYEETISSLKKQLDEVRAELDSVKKDVCRADDYRQVSNCMMRHIYGYYYHMEEEELRRFWAIDKEDVMYAHGNMAHYGFQSIYNYYVKGTNASKARGREIGAHVYGLQYQGNAAPGYRVVHILGSPYIEIAGDGKSAQGVWMAYSTMSQMEESGLADPQQIIQRFSGDFLKEDDGWKIWHVRDYEDFFFKPKEIMPNLSGTARPDDPPRKYGPFANDEERKAAGIVKLEFESAEIYQPWTVTAQEPHLPEPYGSWEDTVPNIRVQKE